MKDKYWLPKGIKLKEGQEYGPRRKSQIFVDEKYGEFTSRFEQLQKYGYSTHPKRQKKRYNTTINKRKDIKQKKCTKCFKIKSIDKFNSSNNKNGYKSSCKECTKLYRQTKEYKEKRKILNSTEKMKKYQQQYKQRNIRYLNEYWKEYRKKNKDTISTKHREYRVRKKSSRLNCNEEQLKMTKIKRLLGPLYHIDHIVPISNTNICGLDYINNLQILTKHENLFKQNKFDNTKTNNSWISEFYEYKRFNIIREGIDKIIDGEINIFSNEWNTKFSGCLNFIVKNKFRVYARKCQIKEVQKEVADWFFDNHHIQGKKSALKYFGLYYENSLISIASFSKGHHQTIKDEIHLSRFATVRGYQVIGGLGKLSKYASGFFKKNIYTFVHNRLSDGSSYIKSGWEYISGVSPKYNFFKEGELLTLQQFKKHMIPNFTDTECANIKGFIKVYDSGKIKLVYVYNQ